MVPGAADGRPARRRRTALAWVAFGMGAILLVAAVVAPMVFVGYWLKLASGQAHGFYIVTVENRSDETVVVALLGRQWEMRPCSVRREPGMSGPRYDTPAAVEVTDATGALLATWSVTECQRLRSGFCELYVRFPTTDAGECPPDDRQQYSIILHNGLAEDVDVVLNGVELGIVAGSGGVRRFDRVSGDWADHREFSLYDCAGRKMEYPLDYDLSGGSIEYELGRSPVVEVMIGRGRGR